MNRWWQKLRETTVEHAGWEMLVMRCLCAWLMWRMLPDAVPFTTQPLPNGLGHLVDLTFLGHPATFALLRTLAPVALVLYALGVAPLLSLGYMAALLTGVGALENSQGAIGHHLQILCLVALAQWVAYAVALRKAGPRWEAWGLTPSTAAHRSATQAAKLLLAAGYVTSGWTKLIASGGQWVGQLPNIALQLVKSQANVHFDTLAAPPAWAEALPRLIADHPNLTRLAFTPGLLLELGAFLALTGRRAAFWIGLGLLIMHVLARKFLDLGFIAHEWLLIIYFINVPWLVCRAIKRFRGAESTGCIALRPGGEGNPRNRDKLSVQGRMS